MDIKITNRDQTDLEQLQARNDESIPQQTIETSEPGVINDIAVRQVLELDHTDHDHDGDVKILVDWAKSQIDGEDPMELKWVVRDLRMRIGTPSFGDPIKHLSRFAYLDLEEKRIKSEKRNFI